MCVCVWEGGGSDTQTTGLVGLVGVALPFLTLMLFTAVSEAVRWCSSSAESLSLLSLSLSLCLSLSICCSSWHMSESNIFCH